MPSVRVTTRIVPGLLRLLKEQAGGRNFELAQFGDGVIVRFEAVGDAPAQMYSVTGRTYNRCTFTPTSEARFAGQFVRAVPTLQAACQIGQDFVIPARSAVES